MNKNKIAALLRGLGRAVAPWNARGRTFELDEVIGPRTPRGALAMPVLFDGGFANLTRRHIFGSLLGMHYAPSWHVYFNDFNTYVAADWIVTETNAAATEALTDGDGGLLLITNTAADNDLVGMQLLKQNFKYEAGKPLLFGARLKVSNATQCDVIAGLQITDATPLAVSDGIWFQKPDDAATLDFHVAKANVQTDVAALGAMVDDTFITLQFAYDGEKGIDYGLNGVKLGSASLANAPDTQALTLSIALQNGDGVARTMTVDYVYAAKYLGRS